MVSSKTLSVYAAHRICAACPALVIVSALFLASCGAPEPIAINLVDRFTEATLAGTVEIEVPERTEWRFDDDGTIPVPEKDGETFGWTVFNDVDGLEVRDGMLAGTTGELPVLMAELPDTLDENDFIYAIELRMRVGEGARLNIRFNNSEELEEDKAGIVRGMRNYPEAPLTTELAPGDDFNDYILTNVARSFPVARARRIMIQPTDVEGAEFAIESVRITTLREHLLSVASGPGWQGLGEIYRETIVSRSPETILFDIAVPDRPWLEISYGTIEHGPVTFLVDIDRDTRLMERTVTTPRRWESLRIDLDPYAGHTVTLSLSLRAEQPGVLGYWGTPVIRSSNPLADAGEGPEARRALADGGRRRPQGVVLLIADTLRSDHLDSWGYQRSTAPFLAQLASEGTRFADNISQGTWTKVSVPSILSSLYPTSLGIVGPPDRVPSSVTILPEVFNDAGYATLSTSSVWFSGRGSNLHQGVEVLHERASVPDLGHSYSKTARTFVDRLLPWLEEHREESRRAPRVRALRSREGSARSGGPCREERRSCGAPFETARCMASRRDSRTPPSPRHGDERHESGGAGTAPKPGIHPVSSLNPSDPRGVVREAERRSSPGKI